MTPPRPVVSAAAERLYAGMSAFHEGDPEGGWVMLHTCEARARMSRKVQDAVRHDDRGSGRRRMHDPLRAAEWYLPRLRDLVGNDDQGLAGDELRLSILERPRAKRCTRPAMEATVKRGLTGARSVRIVERSQSALSLTVITRPTETPDPAATVRAARSQKPLFVRLIHVLSDEPTWPEATKTWEQVDPAVTWENLQIGDV